MSATVDVNALLEQRRSQFISKRRDIELWVENFFKEVDQINPALLKETHPPQGRTTAELLPSLYAEPFSQEAFDAEYKVLNDYYLEIQGVADFLNSKAMEVLQG